MTMPQDTRPASSVSTSPTGRRRHGLRVIDGGKESASPEPLEGLSWAFERTVVAIVAALIAAVVIIDHWVPVVAQ